MEGPNEEEKALIVAGSRATELGCPKFTPELLDETNKAAYASYDERIQGQYRTWWYNEQIKQIESRMTAAGQQVPPAKTYDQIMAGYQAPVPIAGGIPDITQVNVQQQTRMET